LTFASAIVLFSIVHTLLYWQLRLSFQKLEKSVITRLDAEKENSKQVCVCVRACGRVGGREICLLN
jgi:hypothetical protein